MKDVIDFVVAHQALIAGLAVAILDFVFALAPKLEANGLLHGLYLFATKEKAPPQA